MNDTVIIVCYGEEKTANRKEAIKQYAEYVLHSDGSEKCRYANILAQLCLGKARCTDL
ncbi:MAG: hypothetical protein IJK26_09585 [Clostridia bacterium]|nr:hypothetical protein [Clostridia bacterium]